MNEQFLAELIKKAAIIYSRRGMVGLERWANSQDGEYSRYSRQIYQVISERNRSPSMSIYSIDKGLEEEILGRLSGKCGLE